MWTIIVISLTLTGFFGLTYKGYQELVKRAQSCFFAWNNVLGQQWLLLNHIGSLLEIAGKQLPRSCLSPLILAIRQLFDTAEDDIIAIGNHQTALIDALRTLIDAGNETLPPEMHRWWVACQDTFISQLDDLLLAKRHFNSSVTRYNNWRTHLFVYWIADHLGYRPQHTIPIPQNTSISN